MLWNLARSGVGSHQPDSKQPFGSDRGVWYTDNGSLIDLLAQWDSNVRSVARACQPTRGRTCYETSCKVRTGESLRTIPREIPEDGDGDRIDGNNRLRSTLLPLNAGVLAALESELGNTIDCATRRLRRWRYSIG